MINYDPWLKHSIRSPQIQALDYGTQQFSSRATAMVPSGDMAGRPILASLPVADHLHPSNEAPLLNHIAI